MLGQQRQADWNCAVFGETSPKVSVTDGSVKGSVRSGVIPGRGALPSIELNCVRELGGTLMD